MRKIIATFCHHIRVKTTEFMQWIKTKILEECIGDAESVLKEEKEMMCIKKHSVHWSSAKKLFEVSVKIIKGVNAVLNFDCYSKSEDYYFI